YVAVNRHQTIEVLDDLKKVGAGGVICYASGFGEADATGQALQRDLLRAADGMPVIGPNCYGLLNYADGVVLWPDQHGGAKLADGQRGVAIIAQSSNIAINLTMQKRGLPLAFVLTAGNQAQTGLSNMALALLDDPRVSTLGLHIEGFDSIAGMHEVARKARRLEKPVVVLKIGRSEQARKAAFTHTASMAGADNVADAFLERIGIARVNSLSSFLETLVLLHTVGPLPGHDISSLSCSGGEAALIADAANGRRLRFRPLTDRQKKPLQDVLGPLVTVSNPLDYHTYIWGDRQALEETYTGVMQAGFDLDCLIMDFPRPDRCSAEDWHVPLEAWLSASRKTGAKTCVIATMQENLGETRIAKLAEEGIAGLVGLEEALEAIEAAADIGKAWQQREFTEVTRPSDFADVEHCILDEAEGKKLLARSGVTVPAGCVINRPEDLPGAIKNTGLPVALKALGIAHKSEQQAVCLNLENVETAGNAANDLFKLSDRLYLESMVQKPVLELLVGVLHDRQMGLVMTIATGGVMVEVFDDCQTLLLPFDRPMVANALRRLKSAVLFDGFRGRPPADFGATIETVLKIQDFALLHKNRLSELDINPLIVCKQDHGAVAADVLIKFGSEKNV
ncbi:MAG TPA: CoA-binding protein, partial [Rhizobiales bacterium]|nr:CoA-binding protein [Hyphomicrobiales bacterium]